MSENIRLESTWKEQLLQEFEKPYMAKLRAFLLKELQAKKTIYPKGDEYFAALNYVPFSKVRVVILGQDPYHGPNQAHGLCFSVKPGVDLPPSLQNIYKEMEVDLGIKQPRHGYLVSWAEQGVLLLNSVLTVVQGNANSHQGKGWEEFTDRIIQVLNEKRENLVFVLWGSYAQKKGQIIDSKKHLILKAPHPSPLSAHRGFFGCRHFSKINEHLVKRGEIPINWQLPPI